MKLNFYNEKTGKINPVTIFRNDYNGRTYYRLGVSKKLQDGSYENGYIDCQFRKNIEIANKTKIKINDSWLTFYLKNKELDNGKEFKETVPYIFINEFEYENDIDEYTEEVSIDSVLSSEQEQIDIDDLDQYVD